jgi:RNA polymerase sigma factor (sigma-70 family)
MTDVTPPSAGRPSAGTGPAGGQPPPPQQQPPLPQPPALPLPMEELLERHLPELRAYLRRRARGLLAARESASDLAQSVCREVIEHVDRFEHGAEGSFRAWLYRTAERKLVDRYRYYTASKRDGARGEADGGASIGARADASGAGAGAGLLPLPATPSRQAVAREELAAAEAALARLQPAQREAILLSRVEGLPHAEIARRMGRSEGAVRNLVYRGLAQVAAELGGP